MVTFFFVSLVFCQNTRIFWLKNLLVNSILHPWVNQIFIKCIESCNAPVRRGCWEPQTTERTLLR